MKPYSGSVVGPMSELVRLYVRIISSNYVNFVRDTEINFHVRCQVDKSLDKLGQPFQRARRNEIQAFNFKKEAN